MLLIFEICKPKLAEFFQGFRVPTPHEWPLHQVSTYLPLLRQAIELLHQTIRKHDTHVFFHETTYQTYKFTAFPRLENVVRSKKVKIAQLPDVAYSPTISSHMTNPALLGFGESPANVLMLILASSLHVRATTGNDVVHFESHIVRRLIDSLTIRATELLQTSSDRVLMLLHLIGEWTLQQEQHIIALATCETT